MRLCECGAWAAASPCLDCETARRAHKAPAGRRRKRSPSSIRRPTWRRAREQALLRDRHQCRQCGTPNDLEVHHITPIWAELERYNVTNTAELTARGINVDRPDNLATLCRTCHDAHHEGNTNGAPTRR